MQKHNICAHQQGARREDDTPFCVSLFPSAMLVSSKTGLENNEPAQHDLKEPGGSRGRLVIKRSAVQNLSGKQWTSVEVLSEEDAEATPLNLQHRSR